MIPKSDVERADAGVRGPAGSWAAVAVFPGLPFAAACLSAACALQRKTAAAKLCHKLRP